MPISIAMWYVNIPQTWIFMLGFFTTKRQNVGIHLYSSSVPGRRKSPYK